MNIHHLNQNWKMIKMIQLYNYKNSAELNFKTKHVIENNARVYYISLKSIFKEIIFLKILYEISKYYDLNIGNINKYELFNVIHYQRNLT